MLTPPLPLDQDPQNHRFLLVCETLIHSRQKGLLRKLFGKLKGTLCALAEPVLLDCNGVGRGRGCLSFLSSLVPPSFLPYYSPGREHCFLEQCKNWISLVIHVYGAKCFAPGAPLVKVQSKAKASQIWA